MLKMVLIFKGALMVHSTKAIKNEYKNNNIEETCYVHILVSLKNTSTAGYFTLKCAFLFWSVIPHVAILHRRIRLHHYSTHKYLNLAYVFS